MGFRIELLIVFGLIIAGVAFAIGILCLAVYLVMRIVRAERSRAESPR